jgi:hypothetical protein
MPMHLKTVPVRCAADPAAVAWPPACAPPVAEVVDRVWSRNGTKAGRKVEIDGTGNCNKDVDT